MNDINLNGLWNFVYNKNGFLTEENVPDTEGYDALMPVPGYWDDYLESIKKTRVWSREVRMNPDYRRIEYPLGSGKPADASLPYLIGAGWYRKTIYLTQEEENETVIFEAAGAVTEMAVYVNGTIACIHQNPMTGIRTDISKMIRFGQENEIILGVSNINRTIVSTAYRGYKGFTAGIYGDVKLHITSKVFIQDIYAYTDADMKIINCNIHVKAALQSGVVVKCSLTNDKEKCIVTSKKEVTSSDFCVSLPADKVKRWSDKNPVLYKLKVELYQGAKLCDSKEQSFGLRLPERDGNILLLNKRPILLRGLTEHAYFPLTCTAPMNKVYYRDIVRKYKEIGFNWIRFHTTVPHEKYLEACDELGMLVQVEAPNGFTENMWEEILLKCRKHPSVILYCGGNEVRLSDEMMHKLEWASAKRKELAPDTLFSPMQALANVDWFPEKVNVEIEEKPIPHDPKKMKWIKQFSDVLQPQKDVGFNKLDSSWEELNTILKIYERPYTSHEVGICDSYINLDLEHRYDSTRIGTDLFAGARENMKAEGIIQNASRYYRNSCLWSAAIRKVFIEKLRLCGNVSGYDYLGAIDCHWHRLGYTPGILNEFHEYKPGEDRRDILRYNGESVILLDLNCNRNFWCGDNVMARAFLSVYGEYDTGAGSFTWRLLGEDGKCYLQETKEYQSLPTGRNTELNLVSFQTPLTDMAEKCVIQIVWSSKNYYLENEYAVWMFPYRQQKTGEVSIVHSAADICMDEIEKGKKVLLLSSAEMKAMPISFSKMLAGRTIGNTATVVYDQPAMDEFPNEGWCDFQFFHMLQGSQAVVFDEEVPLPFHPVIEVVSSYKCIFRQAALFEFACGMGRVVVCTLNLQGDDPAQRTMLYTLLNYMNSDKFQPKDRLNKATAHRLLYTKKLLNVDYDQEIGFDGNADIK